MCQLLIAVFCFLFSVASMGQGSERALTGVVTNVKGEVVVGATVTATAHGRTKSVVTDANGRFAMTVAAGAVQLQVSGRDIVPLARMLQAGEHAQDLTLVIRYRIAPAQESLVITATAPDPSIDRRNDAVYKNTLFNRDDQLMDTLAAGINAGQHEGGGKSIEVRRFGFNLDHGGVNGGLKVLVDNVQQNQGTQGHGQGYLGQLKSLTPELVDDVDILNGPFSAEYGDFSGLGVVHIRLKDRLEDRYTLRLQGGSFGSWRTFLAWSPRWERTDSFLAYEGSHSDGPFVNPMNYRRDNLTANWTRHLDDAQTLGFRLNLARNDFDSSGQIPIDEVQAGRFDRFGAMDPSDGGISRNATAGMYYKKDFTSGDVLRADGFVTRSLFDLYSNYTYFLSDPVHGDEIQQHDSRLIEGANLQWLHALRMFGVKSLVTTGANYHDNQIDVGTLHTEARAPLETFFRGDAHVTNVAGYAQQSIEFAQPNIHLDCGLRWDYFRFGLKDLAGTSASGTQSEARLQPKVNAAWTPSSRVPLRLHASYGRGINSQDARGVVQNPQSPRIATTDFVQLGTATEWRRFSLSTDVFLIDHSNEEVYVPDDGSFEFKGPSRAYGWEAKTSVQLVKAVSWNAGITQVTNAFYKGTSPREYVDSAPHTVANSGLTLAGWNGFFSSLRYRHISGYIVDPLERSVRATGADVVDLAVTKALRHGLEVNFAVDNLTNHSYYETQNWFESRLTPMAAAVTRLHGTPGYPIGFTVGITLRIE